MILAKDFEEFIQLLHKHKVAYMIVGGYALALHGKPRYTGDLDIWINISLDNAKKMLRVLNDFGVGALGFTADDFLQPGYLSQIGYPPLRIDILNTIDGIEFEDAIKHAQKIETGNLSLYCISLNDLIKNKEASGRDQDLIDIRELKKKVSERRVKPEK